MSNISVFIYIYRISIILLRFFFLSKPCLFPSRLSSLKKSEFVSNDPDAEEMIRSQAEELFLLLDADELLPEGKNIDLKEKWEEIELQAALTYGLAKGSSTNVNGTTTTGSNLNTTTTTMNNTTHLFSNYATNAAISAANNLQSMLNLSFFSYGNNTLNQSGLNQSSFQNNNTTVHIGDITGLPGLHVNASIGTPAARKAQMDLLSKTPLSMLNSMNWNNSNGTNAAAASKTAASSNSFNTNGSTFSNSLGIGGNFRLVNTMMSKSGALIMDQNNYNSQKALLSLNLDSIPTSVVPSSSSSPNIPNNQSTILPSSMAVLNTTGAPMMLTDQHDEVVQDVGDPDYGDNGWIFDNQYNEPNNMIISNENENPSGSGNTKPVTRTTTGSLPTKASITATNGSSNVTTKLKEIMDPWLTLDPTQDAGIHTHRPFKAGRTWVKLHAPGKIAFKGPEAVAAELAAEQAKQQQTNGTGKSSQNNNRLAKQLMNQAKALAQRAANVRAAGPLTLIPNTFLHAQGSETSSASYSSSNGFTSVIPSSVTLMNPLQNTVIPLSSAVMALSSSITANQSMNTTKVSSTSAASSSGTMSSAASLYGTCPEMEFLINRTKLANTRAYRIQRRHIAAMVPSAAATGIAYDENNQIIDDGFEDNDNAGYAYSDVADYMDHNNDDNIPIVGESTGPRGTVDNKVNNNNDEEDDIIAKVAQRRMNPNNVMFGSFKLGAPEDAMMYLHDNATGDAEYQQHHKNVRTLDTLFTRPTQHAEDIFHSQKYTETLLRNTEHEDDEFHAMVKANIALFTANADAVIASTRMQKRIENWQNRMEPLLQEEETRPEFDIIAYGSRLLETMATKAEPLSQSTKSSVSTTSGPSGGSPQTLDFTEIVGSIAPQPYEVCRNFLALLQLANNGNIDIESAMKNNQEAIVTNNNSSTKEGNTNKNKKASKASKKITETMDEGGDESWMFSQAIEYSTQGDDIDKQTALNSKQTAIRQAKLSTEFPIDGHIPVAPSFAIKLLTTVPRYDIEGYVAPSQTTAFETKEAASVTGTIQKSTTIGKKVSIGSKTNNSSTNDDEIALISGLATVKIGLKGGPNEESDDESSIEPKQRIQAQEQMRKLMSPSIASTTTKLASTTTTKASNKRKTTDSTNEEGILTSGSSDTLTASTTTTTTTTAAATSTNNVSSKPNPNKRTAGVPTNKENIDRSTKEGSTQSSSSSSIVSKEVRSPSVKKGRTAAKNGGKMVSIILDNDNL